MTDKREARGGESPRRPAKPLLVLCAPSPETDYERLAAAILGRDPSPHPEGLQREEEPADKDDH